MLASGNYPAVLDACVLIPPALCDVLLTFAETPRLYAPKWTREILDEVVRNLPTATRLSSERIASWRFAVESAFPEAMVEDYVPLMQLCTNDANDRHVLAAAIREKSSTIVTFNIRHFRKKDLEPHGVVAVHPSDYLTTLYEYAPMVAIRKLTELANRRGYTLDEFLALLEKRVPGFAGAVRIDLR